VTIPIRNKRKLIGLLCINMDISKFLQTEDFLKTFLSFENPRNTNDLQKVGSALLSNLKEQIFEETMLMVETKGPIRRRDKNRIIVKNLYGQDFFALKDSVEFVAKKLGVSIFTIYKYIKELKEMKGG
jgi:predicted transcriptional regulator YheO